MYKMYTYLDEERGKWEGDLAKRINRYQNSPAPSYYRLNAAVLLSWMLLFVQM